MKKKDNITVKRKDSVRPKGISHSFPPVRKSRIKQRTKDKLKKTSPSVSSIPKHKVKNIISLKVTENKHSASSLHKNDANKGTKIKLNGSSPSVYAIHGHKQAKKARVTPGKTSLSLSAIPNNDIEETGAVKPGSTSLAPSGLPEDKGEEISVTKPEESSPSSSGLIDSPVEEINTIKPESSPHSVSVLPENNVEGPENKVEEMSSIKPEETLPEESDIEKNKSDSTISDEIKPENVDSSTDSDITDYEEHSGIDKSSSFPDTGRTISLEKVKNLRKRYSDDLKILSRLFRGGIIGKEQYSLSHLKAQERLSIIDDILSKEDDLAVVRELKSRVEANVAEAFKNKFNTNSKAGGGSIPELKTLYDDGLITRADLDNKEESVPDKKVDVMIHKIDNVFDEYTEDIKATLESEYKRLPGEQDVTVQKQPRSFKKNMSELNTKIKSWFSFSKQKSADKNK